MSQTQTSPTLGAQAAAAAATNKGSGGNAPAAAKPADAKPADAKPTDAKASDAKPDDKGTGSNAGAEAAPKKKGESRIYIVVGEVHEFESSAKAEKFLNGEGAPTQYSVLRGKKLKTNSKVSLR